MFQNELILVHNIREGHHVIRSEHPHHMIRLCEMRVDDNLQAVQDTGHGAAVFQPCEAWYRNPRSLTLQSGRFIHQNCYCATSAGDDWRNCRSTTGNGKDFTVLSNWIQKWSAQTQGMLSLTEHLKMVGHLCNASHVHGYTSVFASIR